MMMWIVEVIKILIMRKIISEAKWNAVIDTFVDNFVVTDDGDNMYVGFLWCIWFGKWLKIEHISMIL